MGASRLTFPAFVAAEEEKALRPVREAERQLKAIAERHKQHGNFSATLWGDTVTWLTAEHTCAILDEYSAVAVRAAIIRGAVEIALRVHDQATVIGIGPIIATVSKAVQHGLGPGGRQLKDRPIVVRAAVYRGAVEIDP